MQTHQVHRMKPGVRGLREGAELLPVGVHGGDIKPREGQRPSESPTPGPGPGVGSSGGWRGWLPRGAGQWRRSRAAPTPASLSFRLLSPWTPPLPGPLPSAGGLNSKVTFSSSSSSLLSLYHYPAFFMYFLPALLSTPTTPPHENANSGLQRFAVCSLLCPQMLELCLARSRRYTSLP